MAAPLLRRKRVLAAKIETTVGTAISLGAGDGVFNAFDVVIQPEIEFLQRESQSSFSPLPGVLGQYAGICTFTHEVFGPANAAWATTFLPACGFLNTAGVFTRQSLAPEAAGAGTKTLTIGVYENGMFKQIHGAMGNVVFEFTAGNRMLANFTFRGIWNAPTDVAIVAPTYPTTSPLRFASSGLVIGSFSPKVQRLSIDAGNQLYLRETSNTLSGLHSCIITGRRMTGQIDPEAHLVADHDPFGDWLALTERALALSVGSSGNRVAMAAPKLQPINVQEAHRNDLQTHPLDFQLNKSAALGDDEFTLTLD